MKKIISVHFRAFPCILMLCTLYSCDKDEPINTYNYQSNRLRVIEIQKSGSSDNKILAFSDWNAYDSTLTSLINLIDEREEEFLSSYGYMDDEELNDYEDSIGYDEYQPLKDFETTLSFNSSRQDFEIAENEWLDNENLDTVNIPDNNFSGLDEEELTLLNKDKAVIVNDTFYVFGNDSLYKFSEQDDYLEFVNATSQTQIFLAKTLDDEDCKGWKWRAGARIYVKNSKFYYAMLKIRYHNYPHKAVTKAKIKSYRLKNGKWKKYRTRLRVTSDSQLRDVDCGWVQNINDSWKDKRRKSLGNFASYYNTIIMRVKKYQVFGHYEWNNQGSEIEFLYW